ncbi:MetQ/NlpA family ABC transporter substrate-binding protein [Alkalihalobacillus oceani]|uniref:MetQ/NlpA family ABC transporter substrate-binding protein n=1 Tax=Halalkalibacter oceani TaxID=1653776 RepID=UPI00203BDFD5|nr:MetQ/NlpA family ABC transporter substrate-binding protein [Halalkalibacter oceani]MCM3760513.1 MetQ/NlpA family ABC transporter substrate-binding protein [Halalkalibacter oceani]
MKKFLHLIGAATLAFSLAACGSTDEEAPDTGADEAGEPQEEAVTLSVGASAVPHAEILEAAKPLLAEEGIDLEIVTFQDYILPNHALRDGDIDANYFQTPGYLDMQIEENDYDFVSIGEVHAEPIGIYSQEYSSLEELPEGANIIMSDSISDHGRILPIFERAGLIELDVAEGELATVDNIVFNPKNLRFGDTQVEARMLAPSFESGEGDAVAINTNYALEGGIDIEQYGIAFEGEDVLQPNLIVVRAEDEQRPEVLKLLEVLQSEEIAQFILETYNGAVIPVSQ